MGKGKKVFEHGVDALTDARQIVHDVIEEARTKRFWNSVKNFANGDSRRNTRNIIGWSLLGVLVGAGLVVLFRRLSIEPDLEIESDYEESSVPTDMTSGLYS